LFPLSRSTFYFRFLLSYFLAALLTFRSVFCSPKGFETVSFPKIPPPSDNQHVAPSALAVRFGNQAIPTNGPFPFILDPRALDIGVVMFPHVLFHLVILCTFPLRPSTSVGPPLSPPRTHHFPVVFAPRKILVLETQLRRCGPFSCPPFYFGAGAADIDNSSVFRLKNPVTSVWPFCFLGLLALVKVFPPNWEPKLDPQNSLLGPFFLSATGISLRSPLIVQL